MTPEELERAVHSGNKEHCLRLILTASEDQRRRAAKCAVKLLRDLNGASFEEVSRPNLLGLRPAWIDRYNSAEIAVLGTATLSQLKKITRGAHLGIPWAFEILTVRQPDWVAEWAEWTLSNGIWPGIGSDYNNWNAVRKLIKTGRIQTPINDAYITCMIAAPPWRESVKKWLLADPNLLQYEVWRLFEVEGSRDSSLAGRDKYSNPKQTWSAALQEFSAEGHIDRGRLVTASLDALCRDFSAFHAGWHSKFHEDLKPTLDERAENVSKYLGLVNSRIPATVSFALKALTVLEKAALLAPETIVNAVSPAITAREKGKASLALRLLIRAAGQHPELRHRAALTAADGLLHNSPDVQKLALDIIEKFGDTGSPELADKLRLNVDGVAPSLRARLAALVEPAASALRPNIPTVEPAVDTLEERAAGLVSRWGMLAGVRTALDSLKEGRSPRNGLRLDPLSIPRLDPEERVHPIRDLDELVAVFASVIENYGPPDEIERVLDGVSRLCADRPPDFDRRTSALRKRARQLLGIDKRDLPQVGGAVYSLCQLALAWIDREPIQPWMHQPSLFSFFHQRVVEIGRRARLERAAQLLAAPTHSGGWIDPRIAVARFQAHRETNLPPLDLEERSESSPSLWARLIGKPREVADSVRALAAGGTGDRFDMIQALLRLAPDGRVESLTGAGTVKGEIGAALVYALGGDKPVTGNDAALWIAAARSRNPHGDDRAIESRFSNMGPDAGIAARVTLKWVPRKDSDYDEQILICAPPVPPRPRVDVPTVLHHAQTKEHFHAEFVVGPLLALLAQVWPLGRSAWFGAGAYSIGWNMDWVEARWGDVEYLRLLLDPDTDLDDLALDMLAFGLAAREAGESASATDGLITAIGDGRVTARELRQALCHALRVKDLVLARWSKTLGDAARISPLHAVTVRDALEEVIAATGSRKTSEIVALLELLHELCVETGTAISSRDTRARLATITGTSKSAKLAKALLALKPDGSISYTRQAAKIAAEARIERAERWQRITAPE